MGLGNNDGGSRGSSSSSSSSRTTRASNIRPRVNPPVIAQFSDLPQDVAGAKTPVLAQSAFFFCSGISLWELFCCDICLRHAVELPPFSMKPTAFVSCIRIAKMLASMVPLHPSLLHPYGYDANIHVTTASTSLQLDGQDANIHSATASNSLHPHSQLANIHGTTASISSSSDGPE